MRLAPKPVGRVAWYLRPFFWNQRRKYGAALDAALLWARAPRLFLGVALLYGMIDRKSSPLAPALRSLVTVRISQINHCSFCVDINSATLLKRGVSLEKVDAALPPFGGERQATTQRAHLEPLQQVAEVESVKDAVNHGPSITW